MNPNTGEPGNPSGVVVADKPISVPSPAATPDISRVENLVAAAQQEAAAAAQTTPVQTPEETQFATQFGGVVPPVESAPATPPPAEPAPDLMAQALANLGTPPPAVDALTPPEQTQAVAETLVQPEPEQTPADKLKQQIADSVDAFLEEVAKEKVTA